MAESNGTEGWMWGYGEGGDVVGRVNCTTYVHMKLVFIYVCVCIYMCIYTLN